MTPQQIHLAEKVIELLKSKNNTEKKHIVWQLIPDIESRDRYTVVKALTEDYGLMQVEESVYRLTKEGSNFTSFNDIFEVQQRRDEREQLEFEKTKVEIRLNKWLVRTKWIPHIISVISIAFAMYSYFNTQKDLGKIEQRLEALEHKTLIKNKIVPGETHSGEAEKF